MACNSSSRVPGALLWHLWTPTCEFAPPPPMYTQYKKNQFYRKDKGNICLHQLSEQGPVLSLCSSPHCVHLDSGLHPEHQNTTV